MGCLEGLIAQAQSAALGVLPAVILADQLPAVGDLLINNSILDDARPRYKVVLVFSKQSSIFQLKCERSWTSRLFQNSRHPIGCTSEIACINCFSFQHGTFFSVPVMCQFPKSLSLSHFPFNFWLD